MRYGVIPRQAASYPYPPHGNAMDGHCSISKPTYAAPPRGSPMSVYEPAKPNPNYDPNRVRPQKCSSCPHRPGSTLSYLAPELVAGALSEANHYCHAEQLQGKPPTWLCRGTREHQLLVFHRMGVLAEPTDQCWAETLAKLQGGKP